MLQRTSRFRPPTIPGSVDWVASIVAANCRAWGSPAWGVDFPAANRIHNLKSGDENFGGLGRL